MDRADDVANGVAGWGRLCRVGKTSWDDWIAVAKALAVGRAAALRTASTNRPLGSKYNRAICAWLAANGLDGVNAQERHQLSRILANLDAIEAWRATLDDASRRRLSHPNSIWAHWKRATTERSPAPRSHVVTSARPRPDVKAGGRAVFWSGDAINRGAQALKQSWGCADTVLLARKVLEAAVPTDTVLVAMLAPAPSAKPKPPRPAPQPEVVAALASA